MDDLDAVRAAMRRDTRDLVRDAVESADEDRRRRRARARSRTTPARCSSSTARSPRPRCSARSSSAPTSCCTRPPSTSAATATCRAARWRSRDATRSVDAVEHCRTITGGVASPFNSWLVLRGIRSLAGAHARALRERHGAGARCSSRIRASRPCTIPDWRRIPATTSRARQMSAFGGMLSFRVRGGREEALARHGEDEDLHPRHVPRRRREPDRAPRSRAKGRAAAPPRTCCACRSASSMPTTWSRICRQALG